MMRKLKLNELNRVSVNEFKTQEKIPLIVVLENIRSLNNVGTIFRTSDAFKVEAIYLTGITATPPHREIQKTALGATESVDWQHFKNPTDAIQSLKENGFTIASVEQVENSTDIRDLDNQSIKKLAIVMGNEVTGVEQSTINQSDFCLEIPQFGTKHSLNVGVCAGIVIWEAFKILNQEVK